MAVNAAVRIEDGRSEPRDEVFHRTRVTVSGGAGPALLIVNLSPGGFMARCDREFAIGEPLTIQLPSVGAMAAEVRWVMGGRIGCRFDRSIPIGAYHKLLAAIA